MLDNVREPRYRELSVCRDDNERTRHAQARTRGRRRRRPGVGLACAVVDVAGRRPRAPGILVLARRPLRGRAAPRRRCRRWCRRPGSRPSRRHGQLRRHRPFGRSNRDDPDRRRLRGHARPPWLDRRRPRLERLRGCGRRHGRSERGGGAQRAVRPPRSSCRVRRRGLRRPARVAAAPAARRTAAGRSARGRPRDPAASARAGADRGAPGVAAGRASRPRPGRRRPASADRVGPAGVRSDGSRRDAGRARGAVGDAASGRRATAGFPGATGRGRARATATGRTDGGCSASNGAERRAGTRACAPASSTSRPGRRRSAGLDEPWGEHRRCARRQVCLGPARSRRPSHPTTGAAGPRARRPGTLRDRPFRAPRRPARPLDRADGPGAEPARGTSAGGGLPGAPRACPRAAAVRPGAASSPSRGRAATRP